MLNWSRVLTMHSKNGVAIINLFSNMIYIASQTTKVDICNSYQNANTLVIMGSIKPYHTS